MSRLVPAPWNLYGNGFILLYHFPRSFNRQWGFMDDYQQKGYKGWIGAVMLMNYTQSPAGPYQELLFLPGLIHRGGKWGFSVSKIYTSTEISKQNGWYNWGIPKEEARFEWKNRVDGSQEVKVEKGGKGVLETVIGIRKGSLPFSTKLLPLNRLIQQSDKELLFTRPQASGRIGIASLHKLSAHSHFFPPIQQRKPLAVFSFRNFMMNFPPASVFPLS